MNDDPQKDDERFPEEVGIRENRKLRARKQKGRDMWFGLGTFGMVGWSVAVPTVAAIFAGIWIDLKWPGRYSWTLMLLVVGLVVGCLHAWFWISRQRNTIKKERGHDEG